MSHELATKQNGEIAFAYAGAQPWHGLGQKLEAGADLGIWAKAAGLDFDIRESACSNGIVSVTDKKILYREDTMEGLSVVGSQYKVVQPIEVLDFFKKYVGSMAEIETAGVLYGGRRYWALARLEGKIDIAGDISNPYLMLASSCDGSLPTQARLTSVRVVCNNTLQMSQRDTSGKVAKIRHNSVYRADDMHKRVAEMEEAFRAHEQSLVLLAKTKLNAKSADEFVKTLFSITTTDKDVKMPKHALQVMELFKGKALGADSKAAKGTAFGMLQAVTEWADWHAGKSQDSRLFSSWFGVNSQIKDKAFSLLTEMA